MRGEAIPRTIAKVARICSVDYSAVSVQTKRGQVWHVPIENLECSLAS